MAKKMRKNQTDAGEKYHISTAAIKRSTGLDTGSAKTVASQIYRIGNNNNYGEVVVVTLDIRKSSIALVNLEDFEEYSNVITDYVCYVLKTCQSVDFPCKIDGKSIDGEMAKRECGWFDKFTGDGVIVFWRLPCEPEPNEKYYDLPKNADYKQKLEVYYKKWNETIQGAIKFSIRVTEQFLKNVMPDIRKTCGLLPADFGISVGIDAGTCLLTELKASERFPERCKRFGLKYGGKPVVGHNVTSIGRAIIGATRMVSRAEPYEIRVNSYPGARLKVALDDPKDELGQDREFSIEPICVYTKEYHSVEAYRVVSGQIEYLKQETLCDIAKRTFEKEAKQISNQKNIESKTEDDG